MFKVQSSKFKVQNNKSAEKISQQVFYIMIGLAVLVFGLFFLVGYDLPFEENPDFNAPLFTDVLINKRTAGLPSFRAVEGNTRCRRPQPAVRRPDHAGLRIAGRRRGPCCMESHDTGMGMVSASSDSYIYICMGRIRYRGSTTELNP